MLTVWLAVVVAWLIIVFAYSTYKRTMSYWADRGVPFLKYPIPILGNYLPVLTHNKIPSDMYDKVYKEFPEERMVGLYEFTTPTLVLRDPEVIEEVLIRNFSAFPDHGPFVFEPASGLHVGLFNLYGERWRALRNKLLSTFATERMRCLFPGIVECCEELIAKSPERMDRFDFSHFAGDAFLRGLYGVKLTPEGTKRFRDNTKTMFDTPMRRYFQQMFLMYFPKLADFLSSKYMPEQLDDYFMSIVHSILYKRENIDSHRKDLADLLLKLRDSKKMNIFDRSDNSKTDKTFDVEHQLVLSQGFMFMFAGLETTSLAMLYTAYHLAANPEVQQRAREEVRSLRKKHGTITFDAVREMKYMEQCIQESLRLNPTIVFLMRISDKDTRVGGVPIQKGTRVIVPTFTLHRDPKYFPDPEKYNPDRFDKSNPFPKFIHLPFSEGPRVCLGKKFSFIELTTLFAYLLENFELSVDPDTKLPMEYDTKSIFLSPKTPVVVKLSRFSTNL